VLLGFITSNAVSLRKQCIICLMADTNELLILSRHFRIVPDLLIDDNKFETTDLLKALEYIKTMPEGWLVIDAEVWLQPMRLALTVNIPNSELLNLDTEKAEAKLRKIIRQKLDKEYGGK
jgi:hypothetical protein